MKIIDFRVQMKKYFSENFDVPFSITSLEQMPQLSIFSILGNKDWMR